MLKFALLGLFISHLALAERPSAYTDLLDFVQEAPDQGKTNTCLFVASTGAIELLANKVHGIKNPVPGDQFDLSESYVIQLPQARVNKTFFENPVLRFKSKAIHVKDWPFEAWRGSEINNEVWEMHPRFDVLPRITVPEVETIKLFQYGNRWSTNVVDQEEIEQIKDALWKYKSPVLINYNDEGFWHVILIVGYDDSLPGNCYDTDPKECQRDVGSFYIRDSFGIKVEVRDYDWFRIKGNAAFIVKTK
jgi:hypothetical protein